MVVIILECPMDVRTLALQRLDIIPIARQRLTPMLAAAQAVAAVPSSIQTRLPMSSVVH